MNKKAQALSEWYAKLAENDNGWTLAGTKASHIGPNMNSNLVNFTINPPKPVKKIIDLSMMVGSDIDMEVSKSKVDYWKVTQLTEIRVDDVNPKYRSHLHNFYPYCRVRQNHWNSWQGGDCPIPEGLTGEIRLRDKIIGSLLTADEWRYHCTDIGSDIIAFKVTGIADGYRYEWMDE